MYNKEKINYFFNKWTIELFDKYKNDFKEFYIQLKEQIKYNTIAHDIIYKYITSGELSKEDSKILQTVVKDTLKMVGLGAIAIPIPGGSLLVAILITGAKKFNINLLPSKFNNDIKK